MVVDLDNGCVISFQLGLMIHTRHEMRKNPKKIFSTDGIYK